MPQYKILYKNYLGLYKILITKTISHPKEELDSVVCQYDMNISEFWVHDNKVIKNQTYNELYPSENKVLTHEEMYKLFA